MPDPNEPAGDRNFMTSLARGLTVIRSFSEQTSSLTIADVARITGLPRAAARRCLLTLTQLGYAGTDGRVFFLRPKVLALGYSFLSSAPLATVLDPVLSHVSRTLEESSSAAVLDEDEVVYIARVATKRIMSVGLNIGSRLPANCTSMGRVLLAALSPQAFEDYLGRVALRPVTAYTITDHDAFRHVVEETRRQGFALVDQEMEVGLRSIAVPVRNPAGAVVAAINVSTQASRVGCAEMAERFLPVLQAAASEARLLLVR